jgi:ATP-dependent RNA helicase DHX33
MSSDARTKPSGNLKRRNDTKVRENLNIQRQRGELPITSGRDAIVEHIRENDVTVLLGETGSGKTTQVPQYILETGLAGNGLIAITQPRRVAATSLAARVAEEQEVRLGTRVGYSVRFDEKTSQETRIKFLTDGMIMRELLIDPLLSKYNVVIVDEAHERTVRTDIFIGSLKNVQEQRTALMSSGNAAKKPQLSKLKVLIMSATLDAQKFSHFFNE